MEQSPSSEASSRSASQEIPRILLEITNEKAIIYSSSFILILLLRQLKSIIGNYMNISKNVYYVDISTLSNHSVQVTD
jgi:hypothetical protein